jgi:transcription initiation factor TFIID TATA-box-binding protein
MKIHNVITTANLHQHVDITKFIEYSWGEYDLERYGGRCGYVKDTKIQGRVTVFPSGKMISTGGESIHKSIQQLEHTMEILVNDKFIDRVRLDPKVRNIVATANLGSKIDLKRMVSTLAKFTLEPEQFPGAIYRSPHGPACLIFGSGKIVIAGAKSEKQVNDTEISLAKHLNQFRIN